MSAVLGVGPLGRPPWKTLDPFLFCVHHLDHYPKAHADLAPDPALMAGRRMGMDFSNRDGWSMYHGRVVPGFPSHPHRGFETISITRRGFMDHSDSLGATARFGEGDVQWMTAGKGIVHAEMFPLLDSDGDNTMEMFQIWINLPAHDKLVDPYFTMLWDHTIPRVHTADEAGRQTHLKVVCGSYGDAHGPNPPPNSWASKDGSGVAIFTIQMDADATFTLPAGMSGANRVLYYYRGGSMTMDGRSVSSGSLVQVKPDVDLALVNGDQPSELLMLQGRPIGEPVAHHGPFVMNTTDELRQAYSDYQRTRFGGWPWKDEAPVHGPEKKRFAVHADGRREDV